MPDLPPTFCTAHALRPVAHVLGTIEAGTEVIVEYVTCGTVRVHLPADGVMFTAPAAAFSR